MSATGLPVTLVTPPETAADRAVAAASAALGVRLAEGDRTAMSECYRRFGPMVMAYLRRFLRADEIDDVLQQTFFEVWRASARYDGTRSFEGWILGIARKRAIDQLRRRRGDVHSIDEVREIVGADGAEHAERFVRAQAVRAALAQLPPEQREALVLVYFGAFTQPEVAERLGVPLGTVKARVFRGLRRMSELMADFGPDASAALAAAADAPDETSDDTSHDAMPSGRNDGRGGAA